MSRRWRNILIGVLAAALVITEESLKTKNEELASAKNALEEMTARQKETESSLEKAEESLSAATEELASTRKQLAEMTIKQEGTGISLATAEENLKAAREVLVSTQAELEQVTGKLTETEKQLAAANAETERLKAELTEALPYAPVELGEYRTAVVKGWTAEGEEPDTGLKRYDYSSGSLRIGAVETDGDDMSGLSTALAENYYKKALNTLVPADGRAIRYFNLITVSGHPAMRVAMTVEDQPAEYVLYRHPGAKTLFEAGYIQTDGDGEQPEEVIDTVIRQLTCTAGEPDGE